MASIEFNRYDVRRLYSIAHLFPKAKRCGIYVLCFADGQRYVGQAVDVVRRFGNHRRKWPDIESLLFAECRRAELGHLELRTIRSERSEGHSLRNITHALGPLADSDLDPVVTESEQYAWLNENADLADVAIRADDPEQRQRYSAKYVQLRSMPTFGYVAMVVNMYVQGVIPKPRETERTFWALSALPSTNRSKLQQRLTTLSINKMETLNLALLGNEETGQFIGGFINVSADTLLEEWGSLEKLHSAYPMMDFKQATYEAAGGDCLTVHFVNEDVLHALRMPGLHQAAKQLNLRLMRKGPTFQWRWHCYDLADWAVRPHLTEDELDRLFADPMSVTP